MHLPNPFLFASILDWVFGAARMGGSGKEDREICALLNTAVIDNDFSVTENTTSVLSSVSTIESEHRQRADQREGDNEDKQRSGRDDSVLMGGSDSDGGRDGGSDSNSNIGIGDRYTIGVRDLKPISASFKLSSLSAAYDNQFNRSVRFQHRNTRQQTAPKYAAHRFFALAAVNSFFIQRYDRVVALLNFIDKYVMCEDSEVWKEDILARRVKMDSKLVDSDSDSEIKSRSGSRTRRQAVHGSRTPLQSHSQDIVLREAMVTNLYKMMRAVRRRPELRRSISELVSANRCWGSEIQQDMKLIEIAFQRKVKPVLILTEQGGAASTLNLLDILCYSRSLNEECREAWKRLVNTDRNEHVRDERMITTWLDKFDELLEEELLGRDTFDRAVLSLIRDGELKMNGEKRPNQSLLLFGLFHARQVKVARKGVRLLVNNRRALNFVSDSLVKILLNLQSTLLPRADRISASRLGDLVRAELVAVSKKRRNGSLLDDSTLVRGLQYILRVSCQSTRTRIEGAIHKAKR
jgi:hypothetical protein